MDEDNRCISWKPRRITAYAGAFANGVVCALSGFSGCCFRLYHCTMCCASERVARPFSQDMFRFAVSKDLVGGS